MFSFHHWHLTKKKLISNSGVTRIFEGFSGIFSSDFFPRFARYKNANYKKKIIRWRYFLEFWYKIFPFINSLLHRSCIYLVDHFIRRWQSRWQLDLPPTISLKTWFAADDIPDRLIRRRRSRKFEKKRVRRSLTRWCPVTPSISKYFYSQKAYCRPVLLILY